MNNARRYFIVNVGSNIAYLLLTTVAMTLYIPFLIGQLGIAVYGMVPLANSLITYMSTITDGLNVAINRFLSIDLNRNDMKAANRTFNTALSISLIAVAAMLPVGAAIAWLFPVLFHVPGGLEHEVQILFGCSALTFFLTVINSNFSVSTLALHRFDLRNAVRGLTMIARMGSVIVLLKVLPAHLWYIGFGYVLSAIVSFVGDWRLWRRLTPNLRVDFSAVDRSRMSGMLGLSGWSIVNRIGMLLFLSTDLMVVNVFLGAKATGAYGTLLLFPELLRNLIETVASVLSPAIMARYAVGDFEGLKQLAVRSVKFMGLALALPVGLLCGFARPFLHIWLSAEFQTLDTLLIALIGYLSITLATLPLSYVLTSYNKVRIQGTVTLLLGGINLALSIILVQWNGWGSFGVAASTAVVFVIRGVIFLSGYSAHTMRLPWWTFYRPLLEGSIGTLVVAGAAYGISQFWLPQSWIALGSVSAMISVGYALIAFGVGLRSDDRQFLLGLIAEPLRRIQQRLFS
jgi:membrane protein EpsK